MSDDIGGLVPLALSQLGAEGQVRLRGSRRLEPGHVDIGGCRIVAVRSDPQQRLASDPDRPEPQRGAINALKDHPYLARLLKDKLRVIPDVTPIWACEALIRLR